MGHFYQKNFLATIKKCPHISFFVLSWYNIKMNPKNMKLYVRNKLYFIVDHYQKETCFCDEDGYYHYDIDVDRILLHKKSDKKTFY